MPEILDHVAYLSQQIGPRPAGTEEEQQAALYITEQLQKDAGLSAVIEDFNGAGNALVPRAICGAATLILAVLALFWPIMLIPAGIVSAIAFLLLLAEVFDRPVLSKTLLRGASQNVVARYEPPYTPEGGGARRRKIVLVARYDSGKVRPALKGPYLSALPVLRWVNLGAMAVVPLLLVLRMTLFLHATGTVDIVLNGLMIVALVFVVFPLAEVLAYKFAAYNEGANCNASGVAVLLDVARRVGRGRASEIAEPLSAEGATIHGEAAARAAGLVPEGAELVYTASNVKPPELTPQSDAERLAAAKAAVAALTGKPVSGVKASDLAENLVQVKEPPLPATIDAALKLQHDETREAFGAVTPETTQMECEALDNVSLSETEEAEAFEAAGSDAANVAEVCPMAGSFAPAVVSNPSDGVPDWFKKAQAKAKKPAVSQQIHRSVYADALDAALANAAEDTSDGMSVPLSDMEERLQNMRENIMDAKAPQASCAGVDIVEEQVGSLSNNASNMPCDAATGTPGAGTDLPGVLGASDAGATCAMPPIDASALGMSDGDGSASQPTQGMKPVQIAGASIPVSPENGGANLTPKRRPIVLPDIAGVGVNETPITKLPKQRAPLADATSSGKNATKNLLAALPSIGGSLNGATSANSPNAAVSPATGKPNLQAALPSLSGAIARPEDATVNTVGSFVPAAATGAFAPVGDELIENADPNDIYVDDADDSVYDDGCTETGAFTSTGYVDMPKSRAHRFFDKLRFRKRKEEDEPTPHEWLEVDETFDARTVGAARGGWESFREGQNEAQDVHSEAREKSTDDGKRWQGGGFSRLRMERANDVSSEDLACEENTPTISPDGLTVPPELQEIYQFRNPVINTEVWFVALGSELDQHSGIRTFLTEHKQDLRGSIIIELDALGAGELCMIESEGAYRKVKVSSRMKRYAKKASQATGLSIGSASIKWDDSASSVASKEGFQAMHLAGMEGPKQAFFAQGDDVLENINEETLNNNAEFVMELLKNI